MGATTHAQKEDVLRAPPGPEPLERCEEFARSLYSLDLVAVAVKPPRSRGEDVRGHGPLGSARGFTE